MLTAQLTGGLGNQLFTYSRLALDARELGVPLQLDGSITERVLGHTPDIFEFALMNEPQIHAADYGKIKTQLERALWRWAPIRKISRRHQATLLGNNSKLPIKHHGWKIRGFFQDFKVAEEFLGIFSTKPFTLKNETESLRKYTEKLINDSTVAIHIRRGDYLNYSDSFGVLSDKYYLDAFILLTKSVKIEKAFVFTDSPEMIADISKAIPCDVEVITAKDLSTSETLVLMSRCQGIITSNSTFSFWAAILSNHENVVVPSPWFKSDDAWLNSSNLSKQTWHKCQASWTC